MNQPEDYAAYQRAWGWSERPRRPSRSQRAVLEYLARTGEQIRERDGRYEITGGWTNPRFDPEHGTPRLTAATASALIRERWVAPEETPVMEVKAGEGSGNVTPVDFRRSREAALPLMARKLFEWANQAAQGNVAGEPTALLVAFLGSGEPNVGVIGDLRCGQMARLADMLIRKAGGYQAAILHSITPYGCYACLVSHQYEAERGLGWLELEGLRERHLEAKRQMLAGMGHPRPGEVW